MSNGKGEEDDPTEKDKDLSSSIAYGGARPKTNTRNKVKASGNPSSSKFAYSKENNSDQSTRSKHVSPVHRRRRDFHRTNSSDSVFMVVNNGNQDNDYFAGLQSRTESNSFENWTQSFPLDSRELVTLESKPVLEHNIPQLSSNTAHSSSVPSITSSFDVKSEEQHDLEYPEAVEDDCYIYTYKGGTAYLSADLPNSFFRLDSGSDGESLPGVSGAGQSNLSTGVAALLQDQMLNVPPPSPPDEQDDPDFLELDFDPSSDDEGSSNDSGQGREEMEDDVLVPQSIITSHSPLRLIPDTFSLDLPPEHISPRSSSSRRASQNSVRENIECASISPDLNLQIIPLKKTLEHAELSVQNNNNSRDDSIKAKETVETPCTSCDFSSSSSRFPDQSNPPSMVTVVRSVPLTSPVDDITVLNMPRSKSLNNNISTCLASEKSTTEDDTMLLCGNRLLLREVLLFRTEHSELSDALVKLSVKSDNGSSPLSCPRAMIWSEKEAYRNQVNQLGVSACGATSLMNVLLGLNIDVEANEICSAVDTRLRRDNSELPDYLLSRSWAGCTHVDLLEGAKRISRGRVVGRFFPMHCRRVNLCSWLATWISRGCVPVATLNIQRAAIGPGGVIADAWHHQMLWGVAGNEVYLTNPLEVLTEEYLSPQLDSPSELLIRREDVIGRFCENTDLSPLVADARSGFDERWSDCNVLGQTVNILRENNSLVQEVENKTVSSHLRIPASYSSGVTLFCDATKLDVLSLLNSAADLPFRDEAS